jgi:signal transduction histidine kinase/ActR/RegA family two-component response regulator
MFFALRDLPIKRKLMVVILLTSSVALLLMGGALIVYERITFRSALAVNMNVLARIIGSNSTAALAFYDQENAREILSALLAEKQIKAAAIYDRNGQIFASFPENVAPGQIPSKPRADGHKFARRELEMFEPIYQQGARLGTVYLDADLEAMYTRFRVYGLLLLIVGVCSTFGAMALSARLQRRVSSPILELAKVATAVSQDHDYSVRATRQGGDEIGQLTDAFNEMLARIGESNAALAASEEDLRQVNKEKDNFFAILSHELRTPLTPALAAVGMLEQDNSLEAGVRKELAMIRRNIEVEARLIDDLLDINRIARGKLDLHRQVVDIRALLEHALQNYCAPSAARKKIRVSTDVTAAETHVFADSSRLTQVFWNLLQNACKFTPEGGEIHIRVFNEFRRIDATATADSSNSDGSLAELVVEVRDTGMGISSETLPRIFTAFEQGARSRNRVFGGLGLGLSISRAIMEMHGGTVSATSEGKDKGATFRIQMHTVKAVAPSEVERAAPVSPNSTPRRSMRILVVEDHPETAEQFARLIKRAGHEVICAGTIREAQKHAMMPAPDRACAFDILISDQDLPDGNGRDLMRNLSKRYPIRGIAISGYGMKEDIESSIAAGFSFHITKPVDWQELRAAIQKIAEEIVEEEPATT